MVTLVLIAVRFSNRNQVVRKYVGKGLTNVPESVRSTSDIDISADVPTIFRTIR